MKNKKTLIIAEAGVNHNGSLRIAKKLVNSAATAGADIIKFQSFETDQLTSKVSPKAKYQMKTTSKKESQYDMLKKYQLSYNDHLELKNYCNKKKIEFLSTPFDLKSVILLKKLGLKRIKISSGDINNLPLLKLIAKLKLKTILSTGMSNLKEVDAAKKILLTNGLSQNQLVLLHCTTSYPTSLNEVNLKAMITMQKKFKLKVGYSDHTLGSDVAIAAVAMGASVIEKHFTLDRTLTGPDHSSSLEFDEFKKMVKSIRNVEECLGNGKKIITKSERQNIKIIRKSIHASRLIEKGELFNHTNITVKRPGFGMSPMKWEKIINTRAKKRITKDQMIK